MVINYMDILIDLTRKESKRKLTSNEKKKLDKLVEWFNFDVENSNIE